MLVFLNSIRMTGGEMLAMERTITMLTTETKVLKVLQKLETKTAIVMETKESLRKNFLLLHLGLTISLTPAKVVIACQKNVRSTLKTFASGAE
jgi:hypothetical protein